MTIRHYTTKQAVEFTRAIQKVHPRDIAGCKTLHYLPRNHSTYIHFDDGYAIIRTGKGLRVSIISSSTDGSTQPNKQIESVKERLEKLGGGFHLEEIVGERAA